MKNNKLVKKLRQLGDGALEGGFAIIAARSSIVAGATDPVNNCQGGVCQTNNCNGGNCKNCVLGCGNL